MHRLQKARGAFQRLRRICAARGIGSRTKIRLFKTLVRPVLLYGCETWKNQITKNDKRKLNRFQCQCLSGRIMQIRWQHRITNKGVVELAEINDISCEVRQRIRVTYLGERVRTTAFQHQDGLLKGGGREEAQKLLEEVIVILLLRAKHSEVEELGSSESGCTRQNVLVRQRGGPMRLLAR